MKAFAIMFAVVFSCTVSSWSSAEEIRIEGGGAAISHVFIPVKELFEKSTGIALVLKSSTPVKGLIALEKGLVDATVAAQQLEKILTGAAREGVRIDPATLKVAEIAQSRLVVMVHKSNKLPALNKDQLHALFTGEIANWKQLGGIDQPVVVVWGKGTPGQNAQFTKEVLDGEQVVSSAVMVTDYRSIRDTVTATPGSIGIDPQGYVSAGISTPEIPVMMSPIILITKGEPSPKVQKLLTLHEEEFGIFQR